MRVAGIAMPFRFKSEMFLFVCLSTGALAAAAINAGEQEAMLTMHVLDLFNRDAQRPVKLNLWYQQAACDSNVADKLCLGLDVDPGKVVFLSHGAMGSANELNWLGYGLASRGWVVVGISHHGESWVYGSDTVDPATVLRAWQRPQDISFALDALTADNPFDRAVNWNAITLIGHSSGGQTAAALAGVTLDMREMQAYCSAPAAQADLGCRYARQWRADESEAAESRMSAVYLDDRIKTIVMLDPALGPGANTDSLRGVAVPTFIIGARNNDFLPFAAHAERYGRYIPDAELVALENDEGHFVFIDSCDHAIEAQGIALCRDRPGVDRTKVHTATLDRINTFLNRQ